MNPIAESWNFSFRLRSCKLDILLYQFHRYRNATTMNELWELYEDCLSIYKEIYGAMHT